MLSKQQLIITCTLISVTILSSLLYAQGKIYRGPDDPAGDVAATREGVMDGNQFYTVFRNNTQIGRRMLIDGSKWPKDSEKGLRIFDQLAVLVGAQVFLEQDSIPVTDETQIATRTDLDTLYFVQTMWNYEDMLDQDPEGNIVWGFHAVPGYFNELSETPAMSNDPDSWPPQGWPRGEFEIKCQGEWNGRCGRGVQNAHLETYFVANDAQDQENLQPNRRVKYIPRPGIKIGDKNPNVSIQKGLPWGGLGLRMEVRGYQWENAQTRDVLFWEYAISNISEYDILRTAFGYFMEIGTSDFIFFGENYDMLAGFDEDTDLVYTWDSDDVGVYGYRPGTMGVAFLETPSIDHDGIDNDDDGLTDEQRNNFATQMIGPTDGITDLDKFMDYYGYLQVDQLRAHWDADEDQDWRDGDDKNGNGIYDNDEDPGDDVGLDGVGPGDINYNGPDLDGTECNHRPDLLEGLNSEPNFGLTDVSESDMLGLTSFHFIPWPGSSGINPKRDREFYELFGIPEMVPSISQPVDNAPVFGSGPFVLKKGTTERVACAMIGAYENVASLNSGEIPLTLIEKKHIVQSIYDSDYRFARPPVMPTLRAVAQDGNVVLTWDNKAEVFTREPLHGGENDFEGYKLYKSTGQSLTETSKFDYGSGAPNRKEPIFQCDLKNDYYGYTDYGLVDGVAFYLGDNSGIQHYYIDEDVQNGRTYYYALVAYDHGIKGLNANIAPVENIASIMVDDQENVIRTSQNVKIVTPRQFAAGYVSPNLEITSTNGTIKGTGEISFETLVSTDLKEGHEYRLSFDVDTVVSYKKGEVFPRMGYIYRNTGFTIADVTDSDRIIIQQTLEENWGDHILYDKYNYFYYLNPNLSLDPFDGIKIDWSDLPTREPEYDPETSGWIIGNAPIQVVVQENAYEFFPWQTDIVFTSGDKTTTTEATDVSAIRRVYGIDEFDRSRILKDQIFNFYVENKQFQDSTGNNVLLDVVCYDANQNGRFDMLEDDVIIGYSNMEYNVMKWEVTIATFNFKNAAFTEDLPAPGDVYRIDGKRPFTADDHFTIRVVEPSEQKKSSAEDLDNVKVVPNPYYFTNLMESRGERRLMFTHIPARCTIKIFTISGYLVDEIEVNNEPSNGIIHWDLLTREGLDIAAGIYIYHLKSLETGKEKMGKFAVLK